LVGAGVFLRTPLNLQRVNLGFNQEKLLVFCLQPDQGGYKDERLAQFYQRLFARVDSLPGVSPQLQGRANSESKLRSPIRNWWRGRQRGLPRFSQIELRKQNSDLKSAIAFPYELCQYSYIIPIGRLSDRRSRR